MIASSEFTTVFETDRPYEILLVIAELPLECNVAPVDPAVTNSTEQRRAGRDTVGYWVLWLILVLFGWQVLTSILQIFST